MSVLEQLNGGGVYLICGVIVAFIAVVCVIFMVRAWRAGKALGMDVTRMKRAVTASATFSVLPSVGILLGVLALSGSLGVPWPWLRLSVIGALHYETQVAEAAAEQTGLTSLSASQMTPEAFSTIALVMSTCIMWGMVLAFFHCKAYTKKLSGSSEKKEAAGTDQAQEKPAKKKKLNLSGFGDKAMTAMFIGLVSAYIGSYIGSLISGEGLFTFKGSAIPLAVAIIGALAMGLFQYLRSRFKAEWLDSFSIAGSMLCAMTAAIFLARIL